jgi:hypothetical protein
MTAAEAKKVIEHMLKELPFYEDEEEALNEAIIALHERSLRQKPATAIKG